jgi:hypothetical protein
MTINDSASDFRNINKALQLLTAYESNLTVLAQDNRRFQAELKRLTQYDDAEEMAREWGRVVQGFTLLSSVLLGKVAEGAGISRENALRDFQAQTDASIRQLEHE